MSYYQDEARFGQHGTLTRVWAKVGSRPPAIRQTQYDYLYVFSAVCPETGDASGLSIEQARMLSLVETAEKAFTPSSMSPQEAERLANALDRALDDED